MEKLIGVDLGELIIPTHSVAESIIRGSIMYLALVVILRFLMKRRTGALSIADLLVIVVVADAAQNAFSREYRSVTEGLLLVLTIVFWDRLLDWLAYKYPVVRRLLHAPPRLLVRDGKALKQSLARESLTEKELMSHLRQQGVDRIEEVKEAYLEDDGQISVIRRDSTRGEQGKKRRSTALRS